MSFCQDYEIERVYCDQTDLLALSTNPHPLVFSPGPHSPADLPQSVELARRMLGKAPILGICLGHQILAQIAGYVVSHAKEPCHGLGKKILCQTSSGIFTNMPQSFVAGSYHSLAAKEQDLPPLNWRIIARCSQGEIQGIECLSETSSPAIGLQFHPESFLTEHSEIMAKNWLAIANNWYLHYCESI